MERIAMLAPHFHEYSLRLANALAVRAKVTLFIEKTRLRQEYADRLMPVAPNLSIKDVKYSSLTDFIRILYTLVKFRPATIHIQEPSGLQRAIICTGVAFIGRRFGSVVLTVHDPDPHPGRDAKVVGRMEFFRSFIRRSANIVLVHGVYCYNQYLGRNRYEAQKVIMTEHGVILNDTETLALVPRSAPAHQTFTPAECDTSRQQKENDPAVYAPRCSGEAMMSVIMFGRMEKYKGLDILCAAAERLYRDHVPVKFVILGRGPEFDRLRERFRQLPSVNIDNTFIPAANLIRAIQESTCVVLPYLSATQSGVLAAAFANKKFVIASDVGGIPDVVIYLQNGILVPPGDSVALANAITLAASDQVLRERLVQGAIATAERRLDWDKIVQHLWDSTYRPCRSSD